MTEVTFRQVFATLQVEGLHHWPSCDIPEVKYLSLLHRHMFHIKVTIDVYHNHRDVEFIKLKHEIRDFLHQNFFDDDFKCLNFKDKSCESIAEILGIYFKASMVEVSEDGENGSVLHFE